MSPAAAHTSLLNAVISITSLGAIASLPTITGCVTYNGMPIIDRGTASTIVEHRHREGLHVAVRDLSRARVSRSHFDRNLRSYGFVPVMVLIEVDSQSNHAFILRRDEVVLVLRDGTRLNTVHPMDVIDAVSYSHWRSALSFLLIFPGPYVSSSVKAANRNLETDYLQKSLSNVRVSPSMRSHQGVVFFSVPADRWNRFTMEDSFVELVVYKEGSKNKSTEMGKRLEFPVHFFE